MRGARIEALVRDALMAVRARRSASCGRFWITAGAMPGSRTWASGGLEGPKPVARKSCRARATSWATTEGIIGVELGSSPEVPPKSNRKEPWDYDKEIYRLRNEVERLFGLLKRFRRIFTRYDKLDVVFTSFIYFALIVTALR